MLTSIVARPMRFALVQIIGRGRYLRITTATNENINLVEVQAFDLRGALIAPVEAKMSRTHASYSASKCIDGVTKSTLAQKGFCHSEGGSGSWLRIDYGVTVSINKIIINNRQDCCSDRIVGATISIANDADGEGSTWSSVFAGEQAVYTFHPVNCPATYPYMTSSMEPEYSGLVCYNQEPYAAAGSGPCGSWCTWDSETTGRCATGAAVDCAGEAPPAPPAPPAVQS